MSRRLVVAPDAFKGTAAAPDVAVAISAGWHDVHPGDQVVLVPMADGGEGTLAAIAATTPGSDRVPVEVAGPDDRPVTAAWLRLADGTGVVELASTSGIELLDGSRRGLDAHTRGFGAAIVAALDAGVERLVLAIGSSASTDGGAGILTALGVQLLDVAGRPIAPGARGLVDLDRVDARGLRPLPPGGVVVLADVTNPLLGPLGAAHVFGPQKGLDAGGVATAESGLRRLATAVGRAAASRTGLREVSPDASGAGAAGGVGFALLSWGARLVSGAAEVARVTGLAVAVADADLVITGEGSFDDQSRHGKAPSVVVDIAAAAGVPVALVAGRTAPGADTAAFAAVLSLTDLAGSTEAALADPLRWLRRAGAELAAMTAM